MFDETINSLNINYSHINILETFQHKFRKEKKRSKDKISTNNYNLKEALKFASKCTTISDVDIDVDIYTNLKSYKISSNDKLKIDRGEALLISYISQQNKQGHSIQLLTGDKNCLRALANPELTEITQHLKQKIWCLEQLILLNIEKHGFDLVRDKITSVEKFDTALGIIFSEVNAQREETVKEGLISYINTLQEETGNLLYLYPYPNP